MAKIIVVMAFVVCYSSAIPVDDVDGSTRIINGNIARESQFPYAASLQLSSAASQPDRGHKCGGTLITRQHFLSSSSCFFELHVNTSQPVLIQPSAYHVFAGATILTNNSPERIRPIANFTVHPDFIFSSQLNDIGIATLTTPYGATAVSGVVPLSLPAVTHNPLDFTSCTLAGWGATTEAETVQLRYAPMYIYNQFMCSMVYNLDLYKPNVMPSMICAATFDKNMAGCAGNLGSALVCNNVLTGISIYNGNCQPTPFPELYTRVNNYTTWIRSVTGSASTFAPGVLTLILLTVSQYFAVKVIG